MPRDGNAEARIQRAILEYVWAVAPQVMVFHVANGDLLDDRDEGDEARKRAGARRKWQGVVPGIPDLVLVEPPGRVFFIEVKSPTGVLTKAQREIRDWCSTHSVPWTLARRIEDVRSAFAQWGVSNREAA